MSDMLLLYIHLTFFSLAMYLYAAGSLPEATWKMALSCISRKPTPAPTPLAQYGTSCIEGHSSDDKLIGASAGSGRVVPESAIPILEEVHKLI